MTLLVGSLTLGLLLSLLALGIFISFRVLNFADITAEGSITLGAAVAAVLIVAGWSPLSACLVAFLAGLLAGALTGILHTKFRIHELLAGILMMTALYSVNLQVMGKSNTPLMNQVSLATWTEEAALKVFGGEGRIELAGWEVAASDIGMLVFGLAAVALVVLLCRFFFRTEFGSAMRATGNNPQMIRALGASTDRHVITGLAVSNGLIALSGALVAQYQGFADVQMGIGMLVVGLASVIIGEALVGGDWFGLSLVGAVMGSIIFRLLVAIALRWGMDPNNLKLVTAVFVFIALVLPTLVERFRKPRRADA